jgi:hypothetical protein
VQQSVEVQVVELQFTAVFSIAEPLGQLLVLYEEHVGFPTQHWDRPQLVQDVVGSADEVPVGHTGPLLPHVEVQQSETAQVSVEHRVVPLLGWYNAGHWKELQVGFQVQQSPQAQVELEQTVEEALAVAPAPQVIPLVAQVGLAAQQSVEVHEDSEEHDAPDTAEVPEGHTKPYALHVGATGVTMSKVIGTLAPEAKAT